MLRYPVTFSRSSNIQQRTTKHLKLFQTTDNRYGLVLCCDVLKHGSSIFWSLIWALHRSGMDPETENQVKKIFRWLFPRLILEILDQQLFFIWICYNYFMWILKKWSNACFDQVKISCFSILIESHGIPWDPTGLLGKAVQIGFRVLH